MNRKCAVVNCESRYKGISNRIHFFRFPSDVTLQKEWIRFCGQKNKIHTKSSKICMLHFKPDDFENSVQYEMGIAERIRLTRGAVPSINTASKGNVELNKERAARINRRESKKIVELLLKEHSTVGTSVDPNVELDKERVPRMNIREYNTVDASIEDDDSDDGEIYFLGENTAPDIDLYKERALKNNKLGYKIVDASIEDEELDNSKAYLLGETEAADIELHRQRTQRCNILEHNTVDAFIKGDNLDDYEAYLLEENIASDIEIHKEQAPRIDMRPHSTVDDIDDYEANLLEECKASNIDIQKNRVSKIDTREHNTVGPSNQLNGLEDYETVLLEESDAPVFERLYIVEEEENENSVKDKNSCDKSLKATLEKLRRENQFLRKTAILHESEMRTIEDKMDRMERDMESLQKQIEKSYLEISNLKEKLRANN